MASSRSRGGCRWIGCLYSDASERATKLKAAKGTAERAKTGRVGDCVNLYFLIQIVIILMGLGICDRLMPFSCTRDYDQIKAANNSLLQAEIDNIHPKWDGALAWARGILSPFYATLMTANPLLSTLGCRECDCGI